MFHKNLSFSLMLLRRAQLQNKGYVDITQHVSLIKLLDIFVNFGFLEGYSLNPKKNIVRVFYLEDTSTPLIDMKRFSHKTKKSTVNKQKLLLLLKKNPSSFFILHTRVGLLSHHDCLKLNIFGFLYLRLNG